MHSGPNVVGRLLHLGPTWHFQPFWLLWAIVVDVASELVVFYTSRRSPKSQLAVRVGSAR